MGDLSNEICTGRGDGSWTGTGKRIVVAGVFCSGLQDEPGGKQVDRLMDDYPDRMSIVRLDISVDRG